MKDRANNCVSSRCLFFVFCVLVSYQYCLAGVDPAVQQVLATAAQQVNIFSPDAAAWNLDADFVTQNRVPTEGHLNMKWESKDRFWRRTVNGIFEQVDIRNGETTYLKRNAPFTPVRVRETISLLHVIGKLEDMRIKKAKMRTDRGVQVTCIDLSVDKGRGERSHELCIDSTTHDVLSDEWDEPPDEHRREEFSEYVEFRGHRYPHRIVLFVNGSKVISVHILALETSAPIEASLLLAPPGATTRRVCDGMKRPVPLKTPDPLYPQSARENRLMGDSAVAMTILPDGSVDNIQLVGTSTHAMDDATLRTLKGWKFKPAMCGSEAITVDIEVVVNFRLH